MPRDCPPVWRHGSDASRSAHKRRRTRRLRSDRAGQWSVRVSGNWRVVFRFEDGEAVAVDLVDYH